MGDKTGISWCDATWNCVRGCSRVSPGCERCYAEVQAARIVRMGKGKPTKYDGLVRLTRVGEARWTGKVALDPGDLAQPLRWKKPRRIFVNSMSDLFHEALTNDQIAAVFGVMAAAPWHTFQVLTKRAERMREWFEWIGGGEPEVDLVRLHAQDVLGILEPALGKNAAAWPLLNVWLGVSIENQEAADERIPELLETPAAVRFLSCEPLLGALDISEYFDPCSVPCGEDPWPELDWLIAGCESGPGARECKVEWLRSLRDQCDVAGVPFFLKQAVGARERCTQDRGCGQFVRYYAHGPGEASASCGCTLEGAEACSPPPIALGENAKQKPGGVIELPYLDGVQHARFPEVDRV